MTPKGVRYNTEHIRQLAVYLTMAEIDLENLAPTESFGIGAEIGLSVEDYLIAVECLDPEHAEMLRKHVGQRNH